MTVMGTCTSTSNNTYTPTAPAATSCPLTEYLSPNGDCSSCGKGYVQDFSGRGCAEIDGSG